MGGKLKNVTVKLTAKGGKEGKLFGAITSKEISEGLASQFQLDVPKQKIVLDEPIKAFGTYEVKAKLGYEVSAGFSVSVSGSKAQDYAIKEVFSWKISSTGRCLIRSRPSSPCSARCSSTQTASRT